ncbi:L-aminoadipate-semialdehyde dehydrogenase-phosphopantetheinyl transferase-like [Ipomoea triloba]|uniref:L-aminoadipate-semialdehyde dehydrogenase-phosphopantetheinyl transferase-like n=1 Tax=Ipomoea triloba TaxID=35885 RepID=UPI00125D1D1B|nr:L-aminoadipate-semialdehyde dehydrogenase-phosphopantetheinyl transferase-like [Ipomoea triloba]
MELENGVQRWVVDISEWDPTPHGFSFAMSFLPNHEHSSITRFVKIEDRKRALVSRLLQYALVHQVLGIPYNEICIRRTVEGKPYLVYGGTVLDFPNFNFNASHQGDYVAIASEPICLVGLDIVDHYIPEKESVREFIQSFSSYFSRLEWNAILNAGSDDQMLGEFYRYWSLKEAFVKAMGEGVGHRLDNVEFHHTSWENILVRVDGKELKDWRFWLFELGKNHVASIARGHPMSATATYKKTQRRAVFDEKEYNRGLHLPNAGFLLRKVDELFPYRCGVVRMPIGLLQRGDASENEGEVKGSH